MNSQFNKLQIHSSHESNNTDHNDEGYVESRFDEPSFMDKWTDDQKAGMLFSFFYKLEYMHIKIESIQNSHINYCCAYLYQRQ